MGISPKLLPPGKMHSQGNHLIHSAIVSPCRQHSKPAQRTNLHQHCSQRCCPPVVSLDQHLHVPCMDTSSISWGGESTDSSHSAPRTCSSCTSSVKSGISGRAVHRGADAGSQLEITLGGRGSLSPKAQIKALLCRKKRVIHTPVVSSTICPPARLHSQAQRSR